MALGQVLQPAFAQGSGGNITPTSAITLQRFAVYAAVSCWGPHWLRSGTARISRTPENSITAHTQNNARFVV